MLKPTVHHSAARAIDGIAVVASSRNGIGPMPTSERSLLSETRLVRSQDGQEDEADDRGGQHGRQVVHGPEDPAAGQGAVEDQREAQPEPDQGGRRDGREQQRVD